MEQRRDQERYIKLLAVLFFFAGLGFFTYLVSSEITGYSVFTYNSEANLTIQFNSTSNEQVLINTQIYFLANFTNATDASIIINSSVGDNVGCNFTENSSGSWSTPINMTYNSTSGLFEHNMSFSNNGLFTYNITCFGNDSYGNLSSIENFYVTNCIAPSSGDWIVNASDVLCENLDDLQVNGSLNITDNSNLTVRNLTLNASSIVIYNSSKMTISDSTIQSAIYGLDNSSISASGSNLNGSVVLRNSAKTIFSNTLISSLTLFLDEEISISNLSATSSNALLSSTNFSINLTGAALAQVLINATEKINISSSSIYYLAAGDDFVVENSIINYTSVLSGKNMTATNLTSFASLDFAGSSMITLIRSNLFKMSAGANSIINISSSSIFNMSASGNVFAIDSTFNITSLAQSSNLTSTNISIINILNAPSASYLYLNSSSASAILAGQSCIVNISSSTIYNLTSASDASIFDSIINITDISNATLFASNITVSGTLSMSNATANMTGSVNRFGTFGDYQMMLYGNFTVTQKLLPSFRTGNITRFYEARIYNGSNELNGTANVTYNGNLLWQGSVTDSIANINLTFNSTTYSNQLSLSGPLGYMGKISLLDDTPITKTTLVSSIPLNARLLTANGTLFNDTAYLQFSSNKDIACIYTTDGENYTNATKTTSYYKLYNGTYLTYNNTLKNSMPVLNSTHLPFILSENVFAEFLGSYDNDIAYSELLRMESGQNAGKLVLLGYGVSPAPSEKNASTYIHIGPNNLGIPYTYILTFNRSVMYNNFSSETVSADLLGARIKMMGRTYNLTRVNVNATNGNKISNITFSDDNTSIIILDNYAGQYDVLVNGTFVTGSTSNLIGTPGNWTGINITFYPSENVMLAEGEEYADQVFGRLKFVFAKLNVASTENISFRSSEGNATLNFTDINNTLISIPFYSNGTHGLRGYNSTRPLLIEGENYTVQTAGTQAGMMLFYVKNSSGEAHTLRLASIDIENNTLNLTDDAYSLSFATSYYNSSDNLTIINMDLLGNLTLNISSDHKTIIYQDAPRLGAKTKYGADMQLNSLGVLFNENNASRNNITIQVNITSGANWTYDTTNTLTRVSKIYNDNTIRLANTRYGTMIEDAQNNSYIIINYPQTQTYADVYLAGIDADNASLAAETLPLSSRYTASSNYMQNLINLTCTVS